MNVENKIRVVGIGAAGIRMLEHVQALGIPNVITVAIDTDIECIQNSKVDKKLPLKTEETISGTGGNTQVAKNVAVKYVSYLAKVVKNAKTLILLGGLGGGTASIIAPILAKIADSSTTIISISATPMEVEGQTKNNIARKSFEFLKNKSSIAIAVPNDVVLANSSESIESAYNTANKNVAHIVELIAYGFSSKAFLKINEASLKNLFSQKQSYAGAATANLQNIEDAFAEIKMLPTMESNLKSQNMLVAIRCPKSISMSEIKLILQTARDSFDVEDKILYSVCASPNTDKVEILAISSKVENKEIETSSTQLTIDNQQDSPIDDTPQYQENKISTVSNSLEEQIEEPEEQEIPNGDKNLVPESEQAEPTTPVEFKPDVKKQQNQAEKKEQMLMSFDERGLFENTPKNERKGVDIDIPTYLRKKIKITLL